MGKMALDDAESLFLKIKFRSAILKGWDLKVFHSDLNMKENNSVLNVLSAQH